MKVLEAVGGGVIRRLSYVGGLTLQFWSGLRAIRRVLPVVGKRGVWHAAPEEVGFYDYHRWATDPGAAVTAAVIASLRSAQLFSFVKPYDSQDQPEYLLTGRLERLDELDYGGPVRVEAKLSAELVNLRTGATVWAGEATGTTKVEARNLNSVVAAMSQAVQTNINRLVAGMKEQLSESEAASKGSH